jgi:glutamate-1-semialdehyde 2,1-aminomutase
MVGIKPDMITLGKIIGGGLPIGAVLGSAKILDLLSPAGSVYQAGTLSGNPVALAAGIATLNVLRTNPIYTKLESLGQCFEEILAKVGLSILNTQRVGSIVWLYLDEKPLPRRPDRISGQAVERFKGIYWTLLDDGFYLPPSAYEVLFLSAAHSTEDVEALAASIGRTLSHSVAGPSGDPS